MAAVIPGDVALYKERRKQLLDELHTHFDDQKGIVLLFADFETHTAMPFRQESSFYYLTGITEPGVALTLDVDQGATLFVPNFGREREKWVADVISPETTDHYALGVNRIQYLGAPLHGYQLYPFFSADEFQELIRTLEDLIKRGYIIYTLAPHTPSGYVQQRFILERLGKWVPDLLDVLVDISYLVGQMRRVKSEHELALMRQVISITCQAQEAAVTEVHAGALESDIEARIDYTFIKQGALRAFPSIVAAGKNGTVLHYTSNNAHLKDGDLVVIDIGARYGSYCADITRTYPVSGTFTPQQRKAYDVVLATQQFIAEQAKPGMWLSNRDHQDQSLNHLARQFLAERGYDEFFIHGIGHYLGLDVHDVGSYSVPLQPGDVITIEPGVYMPNEGFGIRIEDDYLITDTGSACLSAELVKDAEEIEHLVRTSRKKG